MKSMFKVKRDELIITGTVYKNVVSDIKPAVILSHGLLNNSREVAKYAELLAHLGYAAFTFDFCGGAHSKSQGKSTNMTLFTECNDLMCVYEYVKSLSFVDPKHISFFGVGQGALVSMLVANKLKGCIESLLLINPYMSLPEDALKGKIIKYRYDSDNIPETIGLFPMKLGREYCKSLIDYDIYDNVKDYEGSVLLLHGKEDEVVDRTYSRRLKKLFKDIVYVEIDHGKHKFSGKALKEALGYLENFMRKY